MRVAQLWAKYLCLTARTMTVATWSVQIQRVPRRGLREAKARFLTRQRPNSPDSSGTVDVTNGSEIARQLRARLLVRDPFQVVGRNPLSHGQLKDITRFRARAASGALIACRPAAGRISGGPWFGSGHGTTQQREHGRCPSYLTPPCRPPARPRVKRAAVGWRQRANAPSATCGCACSASPTRPGGQGG
jgi:hypothetical protein